MIYLDSSILLELYLDGPRAADARALLDEPETKVASWLLAVEIPVVLRRTLASHPEPLQHALDAIHACTALLMHEWTGHAVRLETFDRRLAELGKALLLR